MTERRPGRHATRDALHRLPEALRGHEREPTGRRAGEAEEREKATNDPANVVPPPVDDSGRVRDDGHGRAADAPTQITKRGWWDVAVRVKREVKDDHMGLVGAGVAFYSLLSLFPALVALISVYGLVVDPAQASKQVNELAAFMPEASRELIERQLTDITDNAKTGLGIGLAVSLLAAIWSASGGMRALMIGLNIAYDEPETRKFVKLRLASLGLTFGAVVFAVLSIAGVVGVPAAFDPDEPVGVVLSWLRWPVLALVMIVGLAIIYRYGPNRENPQWRWVSWGAVIATLLWVAMTVGFSFYVSSFGKFNETYGALAGVVVLMLWLALSSSIVLLGAEINAELERQTAQDTTTGQDRPIGTRDAYAADTVGETAQGLKEKDRPDRR